MDYLQNENIVKQRLNYRLKRTQKSILNPESENAIKQELTAITMRECDICKEIKGTVDFRFLICNHELCNSCFNKIKQQNKDESTCPFCRENLLVKDDVKTITVSINIPYAYKTINPNLNLTGLRTLQRHINNSLRNIRQEETVVSHQFSNITTNSSTNTPPLDYTNLNTGTVLLRFLKQIYNFMAALYLLVIFIWENSD